MAKVTGLIYTSNIDGWCLLRSGLWDNDTNFVKINIDATWTQVMSSYHNFAQATTAELSWFVQIWDTIMSLE